MTVELLYFEGRPHHEALLPHLRDVLRTVGVTTDVKLLRVEDSDVAERERFLRSPTLRIDGEDVEPGADRRTDYGMKCRLYETSNGLQGTPEDEWVLAALRRAHGILRP